MRRAVAPVILAGMLALAGCAALEADRTTPADPARPASPPAEPSSPTPTTPAGEPGSPSPVAESPPRAPPPPVAPDAALMPGTPKATVSVTAFLGNQHSGGYLSIAAGRGAVLASSHDEIALLAKDGSLLARQAHRAFFEDVVPDNHSLTDPRVSYDALTDRFFVVAASGAVGGGCRPGGDCRNVWTLAVSKTSTPRSLAPSEWHRWGLDGTLTNGLPSGLWGDFSVVAADSRIVVVNGQMVRHGATGVESVYDRLWVFDKAAFLDGAPGIAPEREFFNVTDPRTGTVLNGRLVPAAHNSDAGGVYLVHFGMTDCDLIVARVAGDAANARLEVRNVEVPGATCRANLIAAPQLGGGRLIHLSPHVTSPPVYDNGSLWIAQMVPPSHGAVGSAVRVVRLDVRDWPETPRVVEDVRIADAGTYYSLPAIVVHPAGHVAVVMNAMSASIYPSVVHTGRLAGEESFRAPVTLMPGRAYHDYPDSLATHLRVGGYSGAALDPVDGSAWLAAQFAARPCTWGAQVARVTFADAGEPDVVPPPERAGGDAPCIRPQGGPY